MDGPMAGQFVNIRKEQTESTLIPDLATIE